MSTETEITLDIPEISVKNVNDTASSFYDTAVEFFVDDSMWLPVGLIIGALFFGGFVRRLTRPRLLQMIDTFNVSFRTNHILKNISKLTFHVGALLCLGIEQVAMVAALPDFNIAILSATSKMLLAWIFIRIIAQTIENTFTRQIVALCAWIVAALSILGVLEDTKQALDAIGVNFGDWRLSLLTIITFTVSLFILLTVTRLLVNTAERSLTRATDLTPSARVLLIKIIKVILISLAILIGVTTAGIDLSAFAIFGGALGLGIGFGLQKVISNLFSGVLLLLDKSIKPGDIIELPNGNGAYGWVSQLGARYVSIITRDNKEYLIPNEEFITQTVINWSYSDRKIRVQTKFGVDYASDPNVVKKLAIEVAKNTDRVLTTPTPNCHLVEFGDSSLNFVLLYWVDDAEKGITNTKGDIMIGLWNTFKENDIEIPYPHRVLIQKNKA